MASIRAPAWLSDPRYAGAAGLKAPSIPLVDDSDWRLAGQERWLRGAVLYWRRWSSARPDWDHDHCEFCSATFARGDVPDALAEGYATADGYHWVCRDCFADFHGRFGWWQADSGPSHV